MAASVNMWTFAFSTSLLLISFFAGDKFYTDYTKYNIGAIPSHWLAGYWIRMHNESMFPCITSVDGSQPKRLHKHGRVWLIDITGSHSQISCITSCQNLSFFVPRSCDSLLNDLWGSGGPIILWSNRTVRELLPWFWVIEISTSLAIQFFAPRPISPHCDWLLASSYYS